MFQWLTNLLCACTTNTSKNTVDINEFDEDPLGWSRDLLEHRLGEFSMAAVKANDVMEDHSQLDVGKKALFVGIYDGQNGAEASNFLITNLFENLMRIIQENNNNVSENILRQVVAEMEELFITDVEEGNQQQPELALVGSSCLFCIVWRGRLYIANVGDSRAVMGSLDPFDRLNVRQLVEDHNARNRHIKKELKKLHPKDPTIVSYNFDAWRVGGISEVSRCIGNAYLKRAPFTLTSPFRVPQSELAPSDFTQPLLSAEPAISSRVLNDVDKFIIFGSGGLWKLLSNWQAAEIVHTNPRDGIAKRILMTALQIAARRNNMSYSELSKIPTGHGVIRGPSVSVEGTRRAYHDDISVIVVFFDKKPELNPTVMPVVTSMPGIDSFRGFDDSIHPSPFRYLDDVSEAHQYLETIV
ncbi:probable protein phosphatase 2C 43 [Trifolium pratense]|uniref:probable protein phosphatase 2C 43 n=1 Tax=Trifolium pratense TaxID=57577 RepID=UPI001E696F69|nr:probable protein phosphatase 2C 43 [Trifolium pratense]